MKRKAVLFLFFCAATALANSQVSSANYQQRVNEIYGNIYQHFFDSSKGLFYEDVPAGIREKPHSFLWPLCALVQAANEAEALQPSKDYMSPVMYAINQYYNNNPPAPGYQAYVTAEEKSDRYYDDNQWIAIACLDAYERTQKVDFLNKAKLIYNFMMTGYDTASGGGIYWKEGDKTSKNTCSNGPGILIALQLFKATGEPKYMEVAAHLYSWVNTHLQSPQGVYYDAIKIPSLKIDSATYTYNTGTMLQSNVLFFNITKDEKFLKEAQRIAIAAKDFFYKNGKLSGNYWFNAVLLRGYIELYKNDKNQNTLQFFIDDANRIWQQERNADGLLGRTSKKKSLIDQSAMMEIYARLAALSTK